MRKPLSVGAKAGQWTLVREAQIISRGRTKHMWLCRCACGTEKLIDRYHLAIGRSNACPKCRAKRPSRFRFDVGEKFGGWTLLSKVADSNLARHRLWLVECVCGFRARKSEEALIVKGVGLKSIGKCQTCTNQERDYTGRKRKINESLAT